MANASVLNYSVRRLNFINENSWAVIAEPKGSIALTSAGRLLMQMSRPEAQRVADDLNFDLRVSVGAPRSALWPEASLAS